MPAFLKQMRPGTAPHEAARSMWQGPLVWKLLALHGLENARQMRTLPLAQRTGTLFHPCPPFHRAGMDSPGDPALQWPMANPAVTADDALQHLLEGNDRFVRGTPRLAAISREKLADLAHEQRPYATIVGCSDSRVAPELVFDAGLGELFVIRVAGNVISPEVMGSVQYAAMHLQTPLFVVLGHEGCGAVRAALDAIHRGAHERSRIVRLLDDIIPALAPIEPGLAPDEELQRGVEANVRWSMRQLRATPEARARAAEGRMRLAGAIYEIGTGRVRFLAHAPPAR